ncbi:unnamed protein product [Vitrella brassicaformis CCMP3155]|uniref:Uncharacterized protein n=1 Tax=Vitrella brassicaformis (strain CCMP3155) TaxID=1169540 RepID=A0A0G4GEI1_VITBC|nr:unnamed protein product [Vitrella brassicaformis CCMP3155]|eukprot:CEM27768.1 unnamed protein product [Vitrella brassicaformis CCMP3155]
MADVMEAADALVSPDGDTNQLHDGFLLFLYIPSLLRFPTKRGGAGGRRKWERRLPQNRRRRQSHTPATR